MTRRQEGARYWNGDPAATPTRRDNQRHEHRRRHTHALVLRAVQFTAPIDQIIRREREVRVREERH